MKIKEKHSHQLPKRKVADSNLVARFRCNEPECFHIPAFLWHFPSAQMSLTFVTIDPLPFEQFWRLGTCRKNTWIILHTVRTALIISAWPLLVQSVSNMVGMNFAFRWRLPTGRRRKYRSPCTLSNTLLNFNKRRWVRTRWPEKSSIHWKTCMNTTQKAEIIRQNEREDIPLLTDSSNFLSIRISGYLKNPTLSVTRICWYRILRIFPWKIC